MQAKKSAALDTTSMSRSVPTFPTFEQPKDSRKGEKPPPFMIGVSGGTASGKTTVCEKIMDGLQENNLGHHVNILSQDSFYKPLTREERAHVKDYNFDHPDAFDFDLLRSCLEKLIQGKKAEIPRYDFVTHSRAAEVDVVMGADVIIMEGILLFYDKQIRDMFNLKLFVDVDADTRLARRVLRDIKDRGRDLDGVLFQYERFVKPSFDEYILPSKRYADVIIPRGSDNTAAIDLLVRHVKAQLAERM